MSNSDELVCRPTKWFLWRGVAMALMFGVGAIFFFKDYKFGYPKKNVERYYYLAFEQAQEDFAKHLEAEKDGPEWEAFALEQKVFSHKGSEKIEKIESIVPADTDLDTRWPDILTDYEVYSKTYEEGNQFAIPPGWKEFSNSGGRTWGETSKIKLKSESKIKEQLYIFILCLVLFVTAIFFLIRVMGRSMSVNGEGFTPAGGKFIPFGAIKRIDIRKWDTKGLAYLFYEQDGSEKKAKVDGMVYGQFKKEDGEPAQKLYERIMDNFEGELIELAPDDDEEDENEAEKADANDSED